MTDCSGRCDERGHRNVHRIDKAGRLIRQPDLALQLLAERSHETRAKALSGTSMYRRSTFWDEPPPVSYTGGAACELYGRSRL
jgi:hypothetical protein